MATTTPNYLWSVPTSSDLVKNGATAIETLGDSIDASLWSSGYGQAGKNKIINGAFNVWQRGTSFTPATTVEAFAADRFLCQWTGTGTTTFSQQTFTPGTAPVAGYEGTYFLRSAMSSGSTYVYVAQKIEDVRTFAGQTATVSFWAKATSSVVMTPILRQTFGSGGSGQVDLTNGTVTLTSSWVRYSITMTLGSVTGKTIGAGSTLTFFPFNYTSGTIASNTIDIWGVQVEAGSVATAFQTATGTIQGELAACQRYLPAIMVGAGNRIYGYGTLATQSLYNATFPVTARVAPTGITAAAVGNFTLLTSAGATGTPTSLVFDSAGVNSISLTVNNTAASPTIAANTVCQLAATASGAYILFTGCEL